MNKASAKFVKSVELAMCWHLNYRLSFERATLYTLWRKKIIGGPSPLGAFAIRTAEETGCTVKLAKRTKKHPAYAIFLSLNFAAGEENLY